MKQPASLALRRTQMVTAGMPMTAVTLPEARGGSGVPTYHLAPPVPGLSFESATRTLSGTPTTAGAYALTYTATTPDGAEASLRFTVEVLSSFIGTWQSHSDWWQDDGAVGYTIRDHPRRYWPSAAHSRRNEACGPAKRPGQGGVKMTRTRKIIGTALLGLVTVLLFASCTGGGSPGTPPVDPPPVVPPPVVPPPTTVPAWSPPTWIHGSWAGSSGLFRVTMEATTYNVVLDIVSTGTFPRYTFDLAQLARSGEANISHFAERDDAGRLYYYVEVVARGYADLFLCYSVTASSISCRWATEVLDTSDFDYFGPITLTKR